jgi:DNA repair exonuclease SbcCD nuclease subunit
LELKEKIDKIKQVIDKGFIVTGDIHLGVHKNQELWYDTTKALFDFIYNIAERCGIKLLVILGDLLDNRKEITQKTLTITHEIFENSQINIIVVSGNHDIYYTDSYHPNWLTQLRQFDWVITVEDEPVIIDDCCFAPWNYPPENIKHSDYLFGHYAINGFNMNDGSECYDSRFSVESFSKFKQVFSGHFHNRSQGNNINYIGSPYQMKFGDSPDKGIWLFKQGKTKFVPFSNAPKFIRVTTEDNLSEELIKGNFVELIFLKEYGQSKNELIIQNVSLYEPLSLVTRSAFNTQNNVVREDVQHRSNKDLMLNFIDKNINHIPEHLNIDTLKVISKSLIKSAELSSSYE